MRILLYHLKRRGIIPLFWVMNNEEEFQMAYDYGAMGIVTDYPERALDFYKKKNIKLA